MDRDGELEPRAVATGSNLQMDHSLLNRLLIQARVVTQSLPLPVLIQRGAILLAPGFSPVIRKRKVSLTVLTVSLRETVENGYLTQLGVWSPG